MGTDIATKAVDDDAADKNNAADPAAEQAALVAKQAAADAATAEAAKQAAAEKAPTEADAKPQEPKPAQQVVTVSANGLQVIDFGHDADAGYENVGKDDVAVPFLLILHPQSPSIMEAREGHKLGLIVNSVTQDVYAEIGFVPGTTTHVFNEWKPNMGGYVGTHAPEADIVKAAKATQEFGEYKTPDGNDLIETFYVHGVAVDLKTGAAVPATAPFKSTGIKGYRNWITNARTQLYQKADGSRAVMPLMSHIYKLGTLKQSKGTNTFWNFTVTWANGTAQASTLLPNDPLFQAALGVNAAINSGKMKTDYAQAGGAGADKGAGGADKGAPKEADIPF